jgi:hypothetical protein
LLIRMASRTYRTLLADSKPNSVAYPANVDRK